MYLGTVPTFPNVEPDKEQVLKIVEEAAEVFSAWEKWRDETADKDYWSSHSYESCSQYRKLLDECADVIQATCNMLAALNGAYFPFLMEKCYKRNDARGRYDIQEPD